MQMLHLQQTSTFVSSSSSSASSSCSATISSFCSRSFDSIRFSATNFSRSLSVHSPRVILLRCKREGCSRFCCKASISSSSGRPSDSSQKWDDEEQFIQASLLVTETIRHYNLRKRGFLDETKWYASGEMLSPSLPTKGPRSGGSSFSHGFLRRFPSPTIFLKVACEGELILPIVVGEFAIQKLVDASTNDQPEQECPHQFQFTKNLVGVLGYEVKKVCITKRVANTYCAQIFLGKTAGATNISIDSRPSDAINMANEFKAPIYVSKKIVLKDAIRIIYGTQRKEASKTIYDVLLDSATEGPDHLMEELDLVKKMNTAIMEERYNDAAIWRDKLTIIRMPRTKS